MKLCDTGPVIEGTVEWRRAGDHVASHNVKLDGAPEALWRGRGVANPVDWLWEQIHRLPEGARVRLSIEVLG